MEGVEVRESVLHGRGLFAVRRLAALTRVAVYGGKAKPAHEVMRRPTQEGAEPALGWAELPSSAVLNKVRYLINSYDDAFVIDPTGTWPSPKQLSHLLSLTTADDEGQVLPEYDASFAGHLVNEPPGLPSGHGDEDEVQESNPERPARPDEQGCYPNALFVQNHHTKQTEVWTLRAVPPGTSALPHGRCPSELTARCFTRERPGDSRVLRERSVQRL
jgi:hypothetical protein